MDKAIGALEVKYDKDKGYTSVSDTSKTTKMFPIRLRLQEDRIIKIEKKFFCDRTTEKTVNFTVSFQIVIAAFPSKKLSYLFLIDGIYVHA